MGWPGPGGVWDVDVAFITTDLDVRGAARRIVELSNHLIRRGHAVTVYTKSGEPCEWLPLKAPVLSRDEIGRHEALICCGGGKVGHKLLRDGHAGLKVLYVLGIGSNDDVNRSWHSKALADKATSFARIVNSGVGLIANCTAIADEFQMWGYLCGVVHGGVDFETFHPRTEKDEWLVLHAGTKRTGTPDALAAIKLARAAERQLHQDRYAFRKLPQVELAEMYSSAMCFIDAHHGGGWNNQVAEAMACGTAVVCTDIDGVQDFAFHKETALLVPPKDSMLTAMWVLTLARDPDLRRRLQKNALAHIRQFTWGRAAEQLEDWLEERL